MYIISKYRNRPKAWIWVLPTMISYSKGSIDTIIIKLPPQVLIEY